VIVPLLLAAVTASLDPSPSLSGNCNPTRVHFTGHITSNTPGKFTYTWVRTDHPASRTITVDFEKPGSAPVSFDILVRKAEKGAVMLRVVFPQQNDSAQVKYQVTCK
jgi:hypothetical protein